MNDNTSSRIEASYDFCRQIARRSGSNFYPSFMLLPREKRRAMHALYAFMRHSDDLGDNDDAVDERRRALRTWRNRLEAALAQQPAADQHAGASADYAAPGAEILPALADTVGRFHVPKEHLTAVIEGVEMDLAPRVYETFEELAEYCHRVASAVGLACIHIWGFDAPGATAAAERCGLAMQLTNILRDMKEDADAGRVYLPAADFRRCGYSVDELRRGAAGPGFERLLQLEFTRAEEFYHEGAALFDCLSPDGRRIFGMMMEIYHRLLQKIRRAGPGILNARARLSRLEKLRIAGRWIVCRPRGLKF